MNHLPSVLTIAAMILLSGCSPLQVPFEETPTQEEETEVEETSMFLSIDDTSVSVTWEKNASVDALKKLLEDGPVTVFVSNYGEFEIVGALPQRLASNDRQMTTKPGDIVLYNSRSLVLFYGANSWAYTRLGKISGLAQNQLQELMASASQVTLSLH